jgi:cardiolipin synthase
MALIEFSPGNQIRLLHGGAEFHPALLAAIEAAQHDIWLETYIFSADRVGEAVVQALLQAARRGVRVRVISDWHGSGRGRLRQLKRDLAAGGAQHRSFNPWYWHGLSRSHRKLCLIDRQTAFIGGMNLNDDWHCDFDPRLELDAARWDFTAQIDGPLVARIVLDMQLQWERLGQVTVAKRVALALQRRRQQQHGTPHASSHAPVQASYVVRDNWFNRRTIQRAYLQAIGNAQQQVLLATPYFAPGRKFLRALASAAERGVQVTLLLGAGQFALQDAVARAFYPRLLKSGVRLFEYRRTQLHGKVAVTDQNWLTVGSSNCDGLSLFLNQEANLVIKDAELARQMREHIEQAVQDASPITLIDFVQVPWYKRAWYELAFWVYLGLMRVVTWGEYA